MVTQGNVYLKTVEGTNSSIAFIIDPSNGTRLGSINIGIQLPYGTIVLVDGNNLGYAPSTGVFIKGGSLILIVSHTNNTFNGKLAETATPIDVTEVKKPRLQKVAASKKNKIKTGKAKKTVAKKALKGKKK